MNMVLVAAPSADPVTVSECKADLRITESDHDTYLTGLISAAVDMVDGPFGILNRCIVTQDWKVVLPCFPVCMDLPISPVQSIQSISYYDSDNQAQTFDVSNYYLSGDNDSASIEATGSASLPGVYSRPDAVSITIRAGYGNANDVPQAIRMAIRVLVGHWFENPVAVSDGAASVMPFSFESLIAQYKRGVVG